MGSNHDAQRCLGLAPRKVDFAGRPLLLDEGQGRTSNQTLLPGDLEPQCRDRIVLVPERVSF